MIFTGERIIPKIMDPTNGLLQEHIYRYKFAKKYCHGRVLDIGCGVGYGSELIAKDNPNIKEWIGIDICQACIAYAEHHYTYPSTNYAIDNALNPNLHELYGTFDTLLCFQTIEYVSENPELIQNLYSLLKPEGILLISSSLNTEKYQPSFSSYYVHRHEIDNFLELLNPFNYIEMYEQMDITIESPKPNKKYCIMIALCKK